METQHYTLSLPHAAETEAVDMAEVVVQSIPSLKRRCRRITGSVAESSWQLQRKRRILPPRPDQTRSLNLFVSELKLRNNILCFAEQTYRIRPIVAAMLRCLVSRATIDWQVSDLSLAVYGRAASIRAIRQTVFRVNRALENVNCPLAAYCQGAIVFLRPRVRSFERIGAR